MKHLNYFPLVIMFVAVLGIVRWVANIVKLVDCDFVAPYKCEVIRSVGVPVFPLGAIIGYIELEDGVIDE